MHLLPPVPISNRASLFSCERSVASIRARSASDEQRTGGAGLRADGREKATHVEENAFDLMWLFGAFVAIFAFPVIGGIIAVLRERE
jgi:hypothetical protein